MHWAAWFDNPFKDGRIIQQDFIIPLDILDFSRRWGAPS